MKVIFLRSCYLFLFLLSGIERFLGLWVVLLEIGLSLVWAVFQDFTPQTLLFINVFKGLFVCLFIYFTHL